MSCHRHPHAAQPRCFECDIVANYPGAPAHALAVFERNRTQPLVRRVIRFVWPWLAVAVIFTGYVFLVGFIADVTTH